MATIQHTTEKIVGGTIRVTWAGLSLADPVGTIVNAPDHTFKEVQVFGTFGAGGDLRIEGSLDGTNFADLNDVQGNTLAVSSSKIERVQESTAQVRPLVNNGDGTTSLTVVMVLKLDGPTGS